MPEDYPSNSQTSRPAAKQPEITEANDPLFSPIGAGKIKKKPLSKRIMGALFSSDASSVGGYVLYEVVVPMVKDLVVNIAYQSLNKAFYNGDTRGYNSPAPRPFMGARPGYTPYNQATPGVRTSPYPQPNGAPAVPGRPPINQPSSLQVPEVVYASKIDADDAATRLMEVLEKYGRLTVGGYSSVVGVTPQPTDYRFGWTDLQNMRLEPGPEGWYIVMPPPYALG